MLTKKFRDNLRSILSVNRNFNFQSVCCAKSQSVVSHLQFITIAKSYKHIFTQKGHKSGQLALAPRRSSSTNFVRASFAHSSTQVRNVTAHSVDGCETRRTQSPFDEIYMARDASGLRFPGSPPPPAAPRRTLLRAGCELSANLGARTN